MTSIAQFIRNKMMTLNTIRDDLDAAMERRDMLKMVPAPHDLLPKKENNLLIFRLKAHIASIEYTIKTVRGWRSGMFKILFDEDEQEEMGVVLDE